MKLNRDYYQQKSHCDRRDLDLLISQPQLCQVFVGVGIVMLFNIPLILTFCIFKNLNLEIENLSKGINLLTMAYTVTRKKLDGR